MPMLKYYDLGYIYTTNDILLIIQTIIFMVMLGIRIYSASKIKNKIQIEKTLSDKLYQRAQADVETFHYYMTVSVSFRI